MVKHIAVLTKNLYNEHLSHADITRINNMPYDELLILREILLIAYQEEFNTVLILDTKPDVPESDCPFAKFIEL